MKKNLWLLPSAAWLIACIARLTVNRPNISVSLFLHAIIVYAVLLAAIVFALLFNRKRTKKALGIIAGLLAAAYAIADLAMGISLQVFLRNELPYVMFEFIELHSNLFHDYFFNVCDAFALVLADNCAVLASVFVILTCLLKPAGAGEQQNSTPAKRMPAGLLVLMIPALAVHIFMIFALNQERLLLQFDVPFYSNAHILPWIGFMAAGFASMLFVLLHWLLYKAKGRRALARAALVMVILQLFSFATCVSTENYKYRGLRLVEGEYYDFSSCENQLCEANRIVYAEIYEYDDSELVEYQFSRYDADSPDNAFDLSDQLVLLFTLLGISWMAVYMRWSTNLRYWNTRAADAPVSDTARPAPAEKAPKMSLAKPAPAEKAPKPRSAKPAPAGDDSATVAQLRQYKALLDEGILTQEEFEQKKKQLLGL